MRKSILFSLDFSATGRLAIRYFGTVLVILTCTASWGQTNTRFNDGYLTIFKVTSGAALNNTGTAIVVEEYLPIGASQSSPNFSAALPITGTNKVAVSGTATSAGAMTRSENGRYLVIPGYNGTVGDANSWTVGAIRTLNASGAVGTGISGTFYTAANDFRGAASDDGTNYWTSGGSTGTRYSNNGTTVTTISTTSTNTRVVNIFNGQLFYATSSGTNGIYQVGTGKPTSLVTSVLRAPATAPYGFSVSPDGLTIYSLGSANTVVRFTYSGSYDPATFIYSGGSWSSASTGFTLAGVTGVAVDWSGYSFTTSANGAKIFACNPTTLVTGNDNGTGAITTTILRTISGNNAFRGLSFSPTKQTVSKGANTPATGLINTSANDVVLFQFNLGADEGNSTMKQVIIKQDGTATIGPGNDISSFRLVDDANNNGLYDGGETVLSTGTVTASNIVFGSISLSSYLTEGTSKNFLVLGNVGTTGGGSTFIPSIVTNRSLNSVDYTTNLVNAGGSWVTIGATPPTGNTLTIQGVAVTPAVNLSVSSNNGSENTPATIITVTATASAPVTGDQTVLLNVSGTNITAGDYALSNSTITILNGQTTGTVNFNVQDDAIVESTETAVLTIGSPSAGIILGATTSQNINITDNDLPTVNLSVSAGSGSEELQTSITVTATASAPVSGNQTVTVGVSGAGITGADYILSGTTITILNGQTTGSITFKIRNDAETEGTETATLTISSPSSGITLGSTTTQNVSITDFTCQPLIRKSTATSTNGAEISAFDPSTNKVFTVAGPAMEYYSLSSAGVLSGPTIMPLGFSAPVNTTVLPNCVAVRNGIVAVSYAVVENGSNAQQQGIVAFYNSSTAAYIHHVTVGYLPDMIVFAPDGSKVMTADEGEPNSYGQGNSFDPEGSVSIIDISGGVLSATVTIVGFTSFNGQEATLRAAGVRIYGPGANAARDLEPEYIAFSTDGTKAYITLQENNAVAELNVATNTVTQILPLGLKNHTIAGNGLDASDQDGGTINIQNWPVYGMYEPDAIASFTVAGNTYYITANEGDSRAWTGFSEEIRVGNAGYVLDPTIFPNAATLKVNANLGRLQLTNATGDTDGDGDFDQIHALGARSFSIWNSTFSSQIFDSGDQLEQISASQNPASFNSEGTSATYDTRSDNKGPEPEAVTTGTVNGVLYAFVGTERTGDIYVYDISNPTAPVFKQYIDHPADQGVEGLVFVAASQSPTGKALIISSAEVSKTVTVYEFSSFSDSPVSTNTSITQTQGTTNTYADCSGVILAIAQSGGSPVSGNVDVKVWIETTQPSSFVKRHHEATPATNASTATGRVTLYFTQQDFDDFNAVNAVDLPANSGDATGKANLLIEKRPGTSSDGSGLPGTYTGTPVVIDPADADIVWNSTANRWEISFDVTGFSGFFVKTAGFILPVQWISFKGNLNTQKQALLDWRVQENNVAIYMIEKSSNGSGFTVIGTVSSRGDGENSYQFTETAGLQGTAYYRIKQTGRDGRVSYSSTIRLTNQSNDLVAVYPNPVKDKLVISISNQLQHTQAQLLDMNGKQLQVILLSAQSISIDVGHLPNGFYMIRFENGHVEKFIKQ